LREAVEKAKKKNYNLHLMIKLVKLTAEHGLSQFDCGDNDFNGIYSFDVLRHDEMV